MFLKILSEDPEISMPLIITTVIATLKWPTPESPIAPLSHLENTVLRLFIASHLGRITRDNSDGAPYFKVDLRIEIEQAALFFETISKALEEKTPIADIFAPQGFQQYSLPHLQHVFTEKYKLHQGSCASPP
jgi:hypothetical protein